MTQPAQQRDVVLERARERYKRTKRLEWSIQCWGDRREDIGRMIELLRDALNETSLELANLEQQLGYRMKDKENS